MRAIFFAAMSMAAVSSAALAAADKYPSKPIRLVASAPGGGGDFSTRLIASAVSGPLGQNVIVENRGGGSIPGQIVAKAQPDGYTLLYYGSALWLSPLMRDNVEYDVVRDFAPITLAISSPNVLVVHPALPVKSVKELVALAKAKPGVLNYGSASAGTSNHLAAELFKHLAQVDMVRIPHKGSGPALISLIGNQVQLMFSSSASVVPHIEAKRIRALAVTSVKPSPQFPELPSIAASGVPGYDYTSIWGIFAPAKTPRPIITLLNQELVKALNKPDIRDKYTASGIDVVASSPEQLGVAVKSDIVRLGKVIKLANIREE